MPPIIRSRFQPHPRLMVASSQGLVARSCYGTEMLVPVKLKVPTTVPPLP